MKARFLFAGAVLFFTTLSAHPATLVVSTADDVTFTVAAGFQPASKAASLPPVSQRKKTISPDSLPHEVVEKLKHEREVILQQALAAKRPLIGSVMTTSGRVWAATWQTIRSKPGCADAPKMGRGAARIPQPRRFLPKRSGT